MILGAGDDVVGDDVVGDVFTTGIVWVPVLTPRMTLPVPTLNLKG